MESDMAAYKNDFLQETYECLDIYNQSFVDLENGDAAAIDEIFRITHTIKGMAGFLGYSSLEHLCHNMEEVLCGIKNGDIEIDGELVDILLSTVDRITDIVKQIESADNDNVKIDDLIEAFKNYDKSKNEEHTSLCTLSAEKEVSSPTTMSTRQPEENVFSISECQEKPENEKTCSLDNCNLILDIILVKDCVMKGLRASLIIESLKDISKLAKTEPDENEMDNSFDGHFKVFLSGDRDKVEGLMDRIPEIEQFDISEIEPSNSECFDVMEQRSTCSPYDCNLVLDVTIVKDCVMKGLRASLIIESLRDVCSIASTDPDENELDNNFDGHLKVFLSGDRSKIEGLMDRISEIECFDISEVKPLNAACNEEIKCNIPVEEETLSDASSTSSFIREDPAASAANNPSSFHSCICSLAARLRYILDRIGRSINCFRTTESAGILPKKKCKESSLKFRSLRKYGFWKKLQR
ncbi:Hpt domain-containing protein [Methanosarcina horonobensis]|uniref:Hpt domain-containing protein n=1 Tax=Methanosarcina horonobensis TaxID=418008 RepID=UPI000ABB304E|nr:Hpt domain-containing protein [Methanosarcina horonobensis]